MTPTLHALWLPAHTLTARSTLALWAEVENARRLKAPFAHPHTANASAIVHSLWHLARDLPMTKLVESARRLALVLPSDDRRPLRSAAEATPEAEPAKPAGRQPREPLLRPWQVEAVMMPPHQALPFLLQLPAGSDYLHLGPSLQFWQRVARLAALVLVRGQYLPAADESGNGHWRAMLAEAGLADSVVTLARAMPASARALARPLPNAVELVHDFLSATLHDYVGQNYTPGQSPFHDPKKWQPKPIPPDPQDFWWLDLWPRSRHNLSTLHRSDEQPGFGEAVRAWSLKAFDYVTSPYRVAFRLEPPQNAETAEAAEWRLSFHLQSKSASEPPRMDSAPAETTLWAAAEVWLNPPQPEMPDRLRAGLAQAASIYPPLSRLSDDLQPEHLPLNIAEAVEFLEKHAEVLSTRGFGVLVPAWWKERQRRLKLQLSLGQREGTGLLGMNTLVDFDWKIAVGDKALTLEELNELAQSKTALVQVRGEWMQFNPDEVQAALKLVQRHQKNQGKLAMGEALALALANPDEYDGLDVESVQIDAWLDAMVEQLSGHRALEKLPQPDSFVGQLRPYQVNGLSWLDFLRQYGFGACLADDMGLGKCVLPDTQVWVNGTLTPIEQIWSEYATAEQSDSDGVWATPKIALWVNGLDEATGRVVTARVKRLYRQRISETVRRIQLADGSQVAVTRQHQLLTRDGWSNVFQSGDSVCVPARLEWEGEPADPDLVELLAWQIAEGYEQTKRHTVTITQKEVARLEHLRYVLARIGQRYGVDLHQPAIRRFKTKTPSLVINSRSYRNFLTARGYEWGKLSREKSIPEFIQRAEADTLRLFLRHYFEAEGSASLRTRSVEISSASPRLMQQLAALMRRFGIWLRVSTKLKRATNGSGKYRPYVVGVLGGNSLRRFQKEIGFLSERKQATLKEICRTPANTNVEGIPAASFLAHAVKATGLPARHFGLPGNVYLQGTQEFSRASLERVVAGVERILTGRAELDYRAAPKSKWTLKTLAKYRKLDLTELAELQLRLKQMLAREVYYCKIKSIEAFNYDGWVYDLEVEKHHNFVANNILCHNTIQFLALLAKDMDEVKLERPVLLVCPTTVVNNWVREAASFAPQLKCYAHHGPGRLKGDGFVKGVTEYHLIITSYALLPRDREFIEQVQWGGVVLDEAHNIKNPVTKQAQIVRQLNCGYRIALTGTPLENRLQDLWSIMHFLNPGYLGSAEAFQRNFAGAIERWQDEAIATRLRALTGPFILRRLKTDKAIIRDLPEKNEMKEFCGLTKEQAALYRSVTQEALRQIAAASGIQRRGIILATLTKLKQVCNHPRHLLGDQSALKHRSGKLNRLTEMLEQALAEDDRSLIFTQYAEMGALLYEHLTETFGEALYLYGGTPTHKRAHLIEQFQNGGPRLFVLSLKAGGAGINLTRANRVFHYDRWWNPAVENQATDRAFRIGQTQAVQVHKMICRGTLEERIDELITRKLALADQIVGSGENWLTELSTDELRDLLLLRKEAVDD